MRARGMTSDRMDGAAAALAAGDIDAALAAYRRALDDGTVDSVTGLLGLTICHGRRRQWVAAENALKSVIGLDPQSGIAYAYLGAVRLEQGKVEAACDDLDRALALAPADTLVRLKRGEAFFRLGRLSEAEAECREAVFLADANPVIRDYARTLLLGIRRELARSLSRDIVAPGAGLSRLWQGVRARFDRLDSPLAVDSTQEGNV